MKFNYRKDIDGLRAFSVLSVLLFHSFPHWFQGGFVGVDIFFVISGYLISQRIFRELELGTFRVGRFYERRIIRIFPALIIVILTTLLFGWFALLNLELKQLGRHAVAGSLFFANFLSLNDAGYFDLNANLKPLLHLWSLGVEEQFYLFWPIALVIFFRCSKKVLLIVGVTAILSFSFNIFLVEKDPVIAFYSPFSRFFELMGGAVVAYFELHPQSFIDDTKTQRAQSLISIIGAILLFTALLFIDSNKIFPGFWVLLPTLGAMLIIISGPFAWLNRNVLSQRPLVWLGLISYPLYLWHWPILSFATIVDGGTPSREIRFLCLIVGICFAWLTFRFIEQPIRKMTYHQSLEAVKSVVTKLVITMLAISVLGSILYCRNGFPERLLKLGDISLYSIDVPNKLNISKFTSCDSPIPDIAKCASTGRQSEKILLIGDSHGMALSQGLAKAIQEVNPMIQVVVVAVGGCSPLRGVESYNQLGITRKCRESYESVYHWAISDHSVKTVLLVSRWANQVGSAVGFGAVDGKFSTGSYSYKANSEVIKGNSRVFSNSLHQTITDLTMAGKKVVFVHQVPEFGFYPPFCGSRPVFISAYQHQDARCRISLNQVVLRQHEYRKIFDAIEVDFPNILVIDPIQTFCDQDNCSLKRGSTYLYQDDDHLNFNGAYLVGEKIVSELF
ncbi:MAG: acyltransferase [Sulfuritalea sp.]|nr:acyltransferase [Sulfuritalea sp.]